MTSAEHGLADTARTQGCPGTPVPESISQHLKPLLGGGGAWPPVLPCSSLARRPQPLSLGDSRRLHPTPPQAFFCWERDGMGWSLCPLPLAPFPAHQMSPSCACNRALTETLVRNWGRCGKIECRQLMACVPTLSGSRFLPVQAWGKMREGGAPCVPHLAPWTFS